MKKSRILALVTALLCISATLALVFMGLWNVFLVPAVGVNAISYLSAFAGLGLIYAAFLALSWAKQIANFVMLQVSLHFLKSRMKKVANAQAELYKHFEFMDKGDEPET